MFAVRNALHLGSRLSAMSGWQGEEVAGARQLVLLDLGTLMRFTPSVSEFVTE